MTTHSQILNRTIAGIFLTSALLIGTAKAQIVSHTKDIVIEQPSNLPEEAQRSAIAFHLNTKSGDGRAYLYIEQENGARLSVLDVTDPGNVKLVRSVSVSVPGPYDFAETLKGAAILVRFRNNLGAGVLDLRKAKAPSFRILSGAQFNGLTQPLGNSALLMVNETRMEGQAAPRDYQVIDTFNPASPSLLYTAKLVRSTITRDETGTTFLLGAEGLTIIRQPRVEAEYQAEQNAIN